jgi:anti-sigma regulatory factor (Ser/Thr protein kinase)
VPLSSSAHDLSAVRRAVADVVARCGADVELGEVSLLADELTTNALRHAGGATDIVIRGSPSAVYVEVTDASTVLPVPRRPSPSDDRGRGLLLVEALATAWGTRGPSGGRKTVWFEVRTRTPRGQNGAIPGGRD